MTYAQKLKDPRWQKRRLHILEQRGWKCERCRDDKTTLHVHHKKYRGQPWEALDHDLEVLCEPCHSGKHGKANSTKRFSVYCAGKIGISDWRHRLFDLQFGEGYESLWASQDGLIQVSYAGPYFADSQHGSAHGQNTHGRFDYEWLQQQEHAYAGDFGDLDLEARMARRFEVHDKCLGWMKQADAYFFYVDGSGAYGTIVELWYVAQAFPKKRKEIFFASEQLAEEYWFLIAFVWRNARASLDWQDLIEPDVWKAFQKFAERV
jgi:hypothetical protein